MSEKTEPAPDEAEGAEEAKAEPPWEGPQEWEAAIRAMEADTAFQAWLRAYNPDSDLEFSGHLLAMHDAWRAAVAGFTEEDMDRLRESAAYIGRVEFVEGDRYAEDVDGEDLVVSLLALADRIASLLPPREDP